MTLTDKQVKRIRQLHLAGESPSSIAERFGLSTSACYRVCNNESYFDKTFQPPRRTRLAVGIASLLRSRGKSYTEVASELSALQNKKWSASYIRSAILKRQEEEGELDE